MQEFPAAIEEVYPMPDIGPDDDAQEAQRDKERQRETGSCDCRGQGSKLHLFDTIQQSPLPLLGQPWVQESPAAIEEVYHVAMCVWMWTRACACVCEYLLAPTMPCISLVYVHTEHLFTKASTTSVS